MVHIVWVVTVLLDTSHRVHTWYEGWTCDVLSEKSMGCLLTLAFVLPFIFSLLFWRLLFRLRRGLFLFLSS